MVNEKDLPGINKALLDGKDVSIWLDKDKQVCIAFIDPEDANGK